MLLLLVMMLWGFNVSALKVLVMNMDPLFLTAVRIGIAGISVLLIAFFMGIFRLPNKDEIKTIGYITIFNVVIHHAFLALGLTKTSGVNAGLILGSSPLITMVLSIILLGDRITRLRVFGFFLGFIGILTTTVVGSEGFSSISTGDGMVFISVLMQAFSFILISKLNPTFDPRLLTGYMLVLGSVIIFIYCLSTGAELSDMMPLFDLRLGLVFLFSAILATAFGHMTYNYAITKVGPAETTIFVNLNTFFAILGAALFLGEPILLNHIAGLILILVGVFIGTGALEYMLSNRRKQQL